MPIPVDHATRMQRREMLAKVESFASDFLADLERRKTDTTSFWCYINFCSPMVMDLIAWERIHAVDLQNMPSTKKLFVAVARAARGSVNDFGNRDPDIDRGRGRRSFNEISEAELAANILPRLMQLLHHWGITFNCEGDACERQLSKSEVEQLTRYYGDA